MKKKKHIIIDNNSQRDQFTKIREFYIEKESASLRENFILDIMRGKEIEFNKNTFFNLADYYYDSKSTNKINPQDELFKLNNISWDIEDIMNINDSHPLVFRDSYNTKNEFYNQFKLALVDLVKNHFITNKAIAENYQNHPAVIKEVEI